MEAVPKGFEEGVKFVAAPKRLGPEDGAEVVDVFEPKRPVPDAGFVLAKGELPLEFPPDPNKLLVVVEGKEKGEAEVFGGSAMAKICDLS